MFGHAQQPNRWVKGSRFLLCMSGPILQVLRTRAVRLLGLPWVRAFGFYMRFLFYMSVSDGKKSPTSEE